MHLALRRPGSGSETDGVGTGSETDGVGSETDGVGKPGLVLLPAGGALGLGDGLPDGCGDGSGFGCGLRWRRRRRRARDGSVRTVRGCWPGVRGAE